MNSFKLSPGQKIRRLFKTLKIITSHLSRYEHLCPSWNLQQPMSDHLDKWPSLSPFSSLLSHLHGHKTWFESKVKEKLFIYYLHINSQRSKVGVSWSCRTWDHYWGTCGGCLLTWGPAEGHTQSSPHHPTRWFIDVTVKTYKCRISANIFTKASWMWQKPDSQWLKKHILQKKMCVLRECVCAFVCKVALHWDNYSAPGWMSSVGDFFCVCLYGSGREEQVEGTERRSRGTWASDSPDEI